MRKASKSVGEGESEPDAVAADSSARGGDGERSAEQGRSGNNERTAGQGDDAAGGSGASAGDVRHTADNAVAGAPRKRDEDNPFDSGAGGDGQGGDQAFERSLGDFDSVLEKETARAGGGVAADTAIARTDQPGPGSDQSTGSGAGGTASGAITGERAGRRADSFEVVDSEVVARVEGCDDPDKVARPLCEAATLERDPFLRASLWDEYKEYKRIVASARAGAAAKTN